MVCECAHLTRSQGVRRTSSSTWSSLCTSSQRWSLQVCVCVCVSTLNASLLYQQFTTVYHYF